MRSPDVDAYADAGAAVVAAAAAASPARRARAGTLLDLVPLGLAIVAEAAWISVAAGLVAEYTLQVPHLGIPALAGFVLAGVLAARLIGGRLGERWPSIALFLVALGGMLGWLADPVARSTLSSQGVVPALGVNVAGWFAGLAVLRGYAHARLPISAATLGTVFGVGIPCLAVAALAGGMIAEPYRARFIADTTVAVIVFAGASTLALAIARLTAVGAGAGFDWRRNPAWVALLVVLVLTTLAVAVPASDASPVIALLAGASVGPILVIGLVVGFNRGMIRTVLLISAGVVILVGLIRLLGGSPLAINLGLEGGTLAPATPNDPGPVAPIGLIVVIVVAMVLVLILARLWSRRGAHDVSDVAEVRSIDHGDATTVGRPRRRFGRRLREPDPHDAVAAYVRLLSDIDGRPAVRREATETPAAHAARLRTTGQADLSFELLAADYALARFGGVSLSATEDRRAVGRWRRLRASLGVGAGRAAGSRRGSPTR